jgi:hypothetical protein
MAVVDSSTETWVSTTSFQHASTAAFKFRSYTRFGYSSATCAESSFRRIKGFDWLAQVISGVQFVDGIKQDNNNQQQQKAAA